MKSDEAFRAAGWRLYNSGELAPPGNTIVRIPLSGDPLQASPGIPAHCLQWNTTFWWRPAESESQLAAADEVNHPVHYTQGDIECIDAIRAALTPEEFRGYLKGNIIKYIWRERMKKGVSKAQWYINKFLEVFGG